MRDDVLAAGETNFPELDEIGIGHCSISGGGICNLGGLFSCWAPRRRLEDLVGNSLDGTIGEDELTGEGEWDWSMGESLRRGFTIKLENGGGDSRL